MNLNKFSLPPIKVIERGGGKKPNLAPFILSRDIPRNMLDAEVPLIRIAHRTIGDVKSLAKNLGIEIRGCGYVFPYKIGFGKLRQILPMGIVRDDEIRLREIGWIPVVDEDAPQLDGWQLKYDVKSYEGGREIRNFMEMAKKGNDVMSFWMSPYIASGVEFTPKSWTTQFGFSADSGGAGNLVYHKDSAEVTAEFTEGEGLFPRNLTFKFKRVYTDSNRAVAFSHGDFGWSSNPPEQTYGHLVPKVPAGERIRGETFERISKVGFREHRPLRYEDLVAAEMFPNLDFQKYDLDGTKTLVSLLTAFEERDFTALDGFNWVKFR